MARMIGPILLLIAIGAFVGWALGLLHNEVVMMTLQGGGR